MRFPIAALLVCVVLLTAYATVLFIQHEADRGAQRRALESIQTPDLGVTCPTDPSSPRYNPATAGRPARSMSDC